MPYGQVDKLCKLVPQNPANPVTLARAIEDEPKLQAAADADPVTRRAFDIAKKLEGLTRHASTHAAGIVIGDRALAELVPLYRDPKSNMPVTQFNMKWVEPAGLVKFDFLGLKTLTVLRTAVDFVEKARGHRIDLSHIPLDDAPTYGLLARAEAVGVFQLESAGMRRALLDMRPDRFEDIVALVALYRPGPMANIPTYCTRKHGLEQPEYVHPKLEPILRETFGVIVYQEQVMQAAQILAGYTLGEADLLRRAMGKKIRSEMQQQRAHFVKGATERGIERAQADAIFDLLERFAEYGFNKSHAAAYALVAYQTAYMKANYPVEFLAASMTLDMGNTDKLAEFREEAKRLGIEIVPPSINRSGVVFEVDGSRIHYALAALKGVGAQAVESIVGARGDRPFADLTDFASRINPRAVNKRVLESLVAAGAFDCLEPDRARAFAAVDAMLAASQRSHEAAVNGQSELFGGHGARETIAIAAVDPWLPSERLQKEYEAIGFFLSGHPLDDYTATLKRMRVQSWAEFSRAVKAGGSAGRLAATVVSRMERRTRSGSKMGIVGLSDPTGHYEAILFAEGLAQYRDLLEPGTAVLLFLAAEVQGDEVRARIQSVEPLEQAAAKLQKGLRVFLREGTPQCLAPDRRRDQGDARRRSRRDPVASGQDFRALGDAGVDRSAQIGEQAVVGGFDHAQQFLRFDQPRRQHKVGAGRIEALHVFQQVRDRDDLRRRILRPHAAYQLLVAGALEQVVRHAGNDDLGRADAGMRQGVGIADVAVGDLYALRREPLKDLRIEVDHADLFERRRVSALQLGEERAGAAEEAKQHDPARLGMAAMRGLVVRAVVEVAKAEPLERPDQPACKAIACRHGKGAGDRQDDEGQRGGAGDQRASLARGDADLDQHQRKFAHLGEIDCGQETGAQPLPHEVERREYGGESADQQEGDDHQRHQDDRRRRQRNGHAERDEEQRDEEVAQRRHLGGDVERVGEGRERDAGDQRAHLARQLEAGPGFADQKAPGERADQNQLRRAGDAVEDPGQHEAADDERGADQHEDARDRERKDADLQIAEVGLHRQEQDGKQILQHQHAERDAAGQGVELALLVQHLDDDDGGRERHRDAEVKRIPWRAAGGQHQPEEGRPEDHRGRDLDQRGADDDRAGAHDLLQVDFQADHEQHQDQAELGDDVD
jgi:hypothetical protein